jgi:hypothetical protein
MYPSNFLNNYLTERDLKEFVNSNRYLDSHSTIIKTLDLESHYFTILKMMLDLKFLRFIGILLVKM